MPRPARRCQCGAEVLPPSIPIALYKLSQACLEVVGVASCAPAWCIRSPPKVAKVKVDALRLPIRTYLLGYKYAYALGGALNLEHLECSH